MSEISKQTIRRLIEEHSEAGTIPIQKLVDLVRAPAPTQMNSSSGLYVVRLYDGMDYVWMDVSKAVPWDEAVRIWNEKTESGMEKTSFDDIDYYKIFPSDTRMLYRDPD